MDDGNKEAIKELLSTYRGLFAINISGLFLMSTLSIRGFVEFKWPYLAYTGVGLSVLSAILMVYLFFLAIPKIARAEDRIIYQEPIVVVSVASFWLFVFAYGLVIFSIQAPS